MTDREYVRVNVTSLTSTPRYNEYGEQYAEVDMQLPSNLINSDNIASARMMMTKAKVSMARIPACTAPVTWDGEGTTYLKTPYKVMTYPGQIMEGTGAIAMGEEHYPLEGDFGYFNWSNIKYQHLTVAAQHVNEYIDSVYDPLEKEAARGYHEFTSLSDFMYQLSQAVQYNLLDNAYIQSQSTHLFLTPGFTRFHVNADNTISLRVTAFPPMGATSAQNGYHLVPLPFNNCLSYRYKDINGVSPNTRGNGYIVLTKRGSDFQVDLRPDPYLICVNEALYNKLHTLPFIKKVNSDNAGNRYGNWDEPYMYILDTRQCNVDIQQELTHWYRSDSDSVQGATLTYHFNCSDAVSLVDVNSIVFALDGVNFTSQILPVNISRTNKSDSQLTTLPAITFYFPVWSRPSDSTTDLIIKEDNFTNGGPLTIDPSLLKQRTMRFKLYYVTSNGDLHEMLIPKENTLNLQVCFEITRIEDTVSTMMV